MQDDDGVGATFGGRLRWARRRCDMSQSELAHKLGVRQPSIANWENDVHTPRPDKLKRLAHTLGAPPTWFMHGQGEPDPLPAANPMAVTASYLSRPIQHVPILEWPADGAPFDPLSATPLDHFAASVSIVRPFALRVSDRAMSRLIPLGATVVFEGADLSLQDNAFHLMEINGARMVRRWRSNPDRLEAVAVDAETLYPYEAPRALGRVLFIITILDDSIAYN